MLLLWIGYVPHKLTAINAVAVPISSGEQIRDLPCAQYMNETDNIAPSFN